MEKFLFSYSYFPGPSLLKSQRVILLSVIVFSKAIAILFNKLSYNCVRNITFVSKLQGIQRLDLY